MATRRSRPAPDGPVLALFGPTASGKTAVAASLAERRDVEIISADSAALYDGLQILTAAPPPPARLVGIVPLERELSVAEYQRLAHDAIDAALAVGRTPTLVGGTGLYLRAALSTVELPPAPAPGARERWQSEYDRLGPDAAHRELEQRDPAAARRIHANDRRRVVRALELWEMGHSLAPANDRLWTEDTRYPTQIFALDLALDELDRRIEARTRAMVTAGAVDEARAAWKRPLSSTARKVLGLEEFATLPTEQATEEVARATKRLARYQLKWLRKIPNVVTLAADRPAEEIADDIVSLERARERLPRR